LYQLRTLFGLFGIVFVCAALAHPTFAAPQSGGAIFTVSNTGDSGAGSLRQAILDANARAGADTIRFDISGSAPHRIAPLSALPTVTDPVAIDGSTQPGYQGAPIIELTGSSAIGSIVNGLSIRSGASVVRALVVNNWSSAGIYFEVGGGNLVEGCFVGTDTTGTIALGNTDAGIRFVESSDNRIGGTTPASRNVISGNGGSYQFGGGIFFFENSTRNVVQGNFIGTDASGQLPLGNTGAGIRARAFSSPLRVGGPEPGASNVIANNEGPGVVSDRSSGIVVLSNSIFDNGDQAENYDGQWGIHFDQGHIVRSPVLTFVGDENGGTRVAGAFRHPFLTPVTWRVEVFVSSTCSEEGYGQGKTLIGAIDVTGDSNGLATFSTVFPISLPSGEAVTATATGPGELGTSPFSACLSDTNGCTLPFVTSEPVPRFIGHPAGQPLSLTVGATGTGPIRYQWYGGGQILPGETAATLNIASLTTSANYYATATNECGRAQSSIFVVVPCTGLPTIVQQPAGRTIPTGSSAQISVAVDGDGYRTFEWYRGLRGDTSSLIGSGNASTIFTPQLTETTSFWVRVSNGCGSVDSETATITVVPRIEITSVKIKKNAKGKPQIVARGANFGSTVNVYVNGSAFQKAAKVTSTSVTQAGKLLDGRSIDDAIPRGSTVTLVFSSPDHGAISTSYTRP
jgi:hypothetical protein